MDKNASGAVVIYKNKILLILRDDIPEISNPNKWGLPGGEMEEGESHEETFLREFEEELGVAPQTYDYLGYLPSDNGTRANFYLVKLSEAEAKKLKLGDEGQRFDFFSFDDLEGLDLVKRMVPLIITHKEKIKAVLEGKTSIKNEDFGLKNED